MSGCWEAEAKDRPSADDILHIASDPDFISLQEAVRSESAIEYVTASCIHTKTVALDMSTSFMGKWESALSIHQQNCMSDVHKIFTISPMLCFSIQHHASMVSYG